MSMSTLQENTIQENSVVTMNYTLRDDEGTILDQTAGEPFEYLHGHNMIIAGLESAITGLTVGTQQTVTVSPESAYGIYNEALSFDVPLAHFGDQQPEPETMVQVNQPGAPPLMVQVIKVENDMVTLDANHPLAGKTLHFELEVLGVRPATQEELSHGHVHGEHGHHHH